MRIAREKRYNQLSLRCQLLVICFGTYSCGEFIAKAEGYVYLPLKPPRLQSGEALLRVS